MGSCPSVRICPCGHTRAHYSMTATTLSSSTLSTPAHSAMSMRSNAGDGTAGPRTVQSTRGGLGRGRARRWSGRGMFPKRALLPISTAGRRTRRRLSGDRHNQPILPLEVPVGRQQLRVPRTHNRALDHLPSLVNLTSSTPAPATTQV